jgi:hypothetical protein
MALPPLPQGAVFIEGNELPPLPAGAKFVSSDLSVPTIMSEEEQKAAEKKYRDYESSFGHRAGQFAEEGLRMLEGLPIAGVEAQIGEAAIPYLINKTPVLEKTLSAIPDIEKITSHPLYKKTSEIVEPITENVQAAAKKTGEFLKDIPLSTQSFLSGKPKEELKAMYNIGKEKSGKLLDEFNKWAKNEFVPIANRGDYNTAIAEGLPHELAVQATHRRSDLEKGVWYMKNLYNNNYVPSKMGISRKKFDADRASLLEDLLPQAVSEAQRLGMKYGEPIPTNLRDLTNIGAHSLGWGGVGGLGSMLLHGVFNLKTAGIPFVTKMIAGSPKLNAEIAIGAGKAAKYTPSILQGTKNIPTPALIGGLNYMGITNDNED